MTPETEPDVGGLINAVLHIALVLVWPLIVLWSLRQFGAPVTYSLPCYLAAMALVVSVKAAKR